MYDIYLLMVNLLFTLFLIDPDIKSKQVDYGFKVFFRKDDQSFEKSIYCIQNIPEFLK